MSFEQYVGLVIALVGGVVSIMKAYSSLIMSHAKENEAQADAIKEDSKAEAAQSTAFISLVTSQNSQYGEILKQLTDARNQILDLERRYGVTAAKVVELEGELKLVRQEAEQERRHKETLAKENEALRAENRLLKEELNAIKPSV